MPGALTAVVGTAFYPRITYNGNVLDLMPSCSQLKLRPSTVQNSDIAGSGARQVLTERDETLVTLSWLFLTPVMVGQLMTFYTSWGKEKKQSTLVLDRFNTCAGQWEYDSYNTYFTKAELENNPLEFARVIPGGGGFFGVDLLFRQGV